MEAFFLLPIASSSPAKLSSVSDGASSVSVGDGAGGASWAFWLLVAWVAPKAGRLWHPPMHGPQQQSRHQLVFGTQTS